MMSMLKNYSVSGPGAWTGRVDDPDDPRSFRWHQIIDFIDLNSRHPFPSKKSGQGFCFIGFCCDEGVKRNLGRPGTSKAPDSIRGECSDLPSRYPGEMRLFDAGNIHCGEEDLETAQGDLAQAVSAILTAGLFPIVLGGGHEIALGHFNGMVDFLGQQGDGATERLGIINFDSHFDLRPYPRGGNSGTMFLQIADGCREKNLDFLYFCLGIQQYGNTVKLFETAERLGVRYVYAKDINEMNLEKIFTKLIKFISEVDRVYLTICTDVFSSAFAPGVSNPQPFGLDPEIVLKLIKHIIHTKKVMGVDVAEVSPRFDQDNRTAKLIAIIIFSIINTRMNLEAETGKRKT